MLANGTADGWINAGEKLLDRIANRPGVERAEPMITASNIHYEFADRVQGLGPGGIGAMLLLSRRIGLIRDIDHNLRLLKRHSPYHESDHVLNIAFNHLAGGKRIEHIELRRNDEVYLDALGAQRLPDPTTEGDFCRRFSEHDVVTLMDAIDQTRLRVWAQQPSSFFTEAFLDVDGTLVSTDAECKGGIGIAYNGVWGYHPLLISLANTSEPLYLMNRSGNRPSHDHAAGALDKMINLCRQAGFERIVLQGDTDFTQTAHLDRWDQAGDIRFIFGIDARATLKGLADDLPAEKYRLLERPPRYAIKTKPREKPERIKSEIVRERGYKTINFLEEMVAEFDYRPLACNKSYRLIVVRKRLGVDQGQMRLFEEYRYLFYVTNDRTRTAEEIVFAANDRCDQENLIANSKGECTRFNPGEQPSEQLGLHGNGQPGVEPEGIGTLMLQLSPRHAAKHEAETDMAADGIRDVLCGGDPDALPDCEAAKRLIYRLLSWNPWQGTFLRLVERLHGAWLY